MKIAAQLGEFERLSESRIMYFDVGGKPHTQHLAYDTRNKSIYLYPTIINPKDPQGPSILRF